MKPQNNHRILVQILHQIAGEKKIKMTTFSQDWIIRLEKDGLVKYIYGYDFDLNSASVQLIAKDKSAVSDLLEFNHLPHVEHQLFLHPRQAAYVSSAGNWSEILKFAQKHHFNLVCKPNQGTGGHGIFHTQDCLSLEKAVHELFTANRAISLSPFYDIKNEYRVYVLKNDCQLTYCKTLPNIIGDGRLSIADLIMAKSKQELTPEVVKQAVQTYADCLDQIPKSGDSLSLVWKHNLGQGALPEIITNPTLLTRLKKLALACAQALNLSFAAIDIIKTDNKYLVLEVNSGIMMESFAMLSPQNHAIAKSIYTNAIDLMFDNSHILTKNTPTKPSCKNFGCLQDFFAIIML